MTITDKTCNQVESELARIVASVVGFLGHDWHRVPNVGSRQEIAHKSGLRLLFRTNYQLKGRIEISGQAPSVSLIPNGQHVFKSNAGWDYLNRKVKNEITVSADKTASKITQDITRRLLPHFQPAWNVALTKMHTHFNHQQNKFKITQALADACGGKVCPLDLTKGHGNQGDERVDSFTVHDPDLIDLRLSLDFTEAKLILDFLKTIPKN